MCRKLFKKNVITVSKKRTQLQGHHVALKVHRGTLGTACSFLFYSGPVWEFNFTLIFLFSSQPPIHLSFLLIVPSFFFPIILSFFGSLFLYIQSPSHRSLTEVKRKIEAVKNDFLYLYVSYTVIYVFESEFAYGVRARAFASAFILFVVNANLTFETFFQ